MSQNDLRVLEGSWKFQESESRAYGRMVGGQLRIAYCFAGSPRMIGQMYDWRQTGDTWVARFQWVSGALSGFVYLKPVTANRMEGGWWSALSDAPHPVFPQGLPPSQTIVPSVWQRMPHDTAVPEWAEQLLSPA